MKPIMNNLIICGIPRSGTTLVASLIDSANNSVVLNEPLMNDKPSDMCDKREFVNLTKREFENYRTDILKNREVMDRVSIDDTLLTNYLARDNSGSPIQSYKIEKRKLQPLSKTFLLGIKKNAGYLATLEELVKLKNTQVLLIARNPIETILSWRATPFPIAKGLLPGGEILCPEIKKITTSGNNTLVKQVKLYKLFIEKFMNVSDKVDLMHYEDIILNPNLLKDRLKLDQIKDGIVEKKMNRKYINRDCEEKLQRTFNSIAGESYNKFLNIFPRKFHQNIC